MNGADYRQRSVWFRGATRSLLCVYSAVLAGLLVVASPVWLGKMRRGGKYREGWRERFGFVPGRLKRPGDGPVVWVHAVSVGEAIAASAMVRKLRVELPGAAVYVSTTTRTGQAVARERFGADAVFYFPADFAFAVRAWLRFLRPDAVVLVESEFWPRMLVETAVAGVPMAVVNARVSDRSWPRYQRLRALWKPLLHSTLRVVQAQSVVDAERLRGLGLEWAEVSGNLKYDVTPPAQEPELVAALRGALPTAVPVLVCGSTLAGEEAVVVDGLPKDCIAVVAPRHPERFEEAFAALAASGRPVVRRSEWAGQRLERGTVVLLDSIGELAAVYGLATVAVLGGGFLHRGGHNPLEAAQWGVPVVMGTGVENFREIVERLKAEDAVVLAEDSELRGVLERLLGNTQQARAMGERGRLVCERERGATERAVRAVVALVRERAG